MDRQNPQFSSAARQGEIGVGIVSQIVHRDLNWLFTRVPQEHDFGIDGQFAIIDESGGVTGQMLAVQIKCGPSYLKDTNRWGYVYRGQTKHINYLSNYPSPVLILLCDPKTNRVYWEIFDALEIDRTSNGWTMTIPFKNVLQESKPDLLRIVGNPTNQLAELESYWRQNKLIAESSVIWVWVDKPAVDAADTSSVEEVFNRLRATKALALASRGKVEISFDGYNSDSRQLCEIPEVCKYVTLLDHSLNDLFFFVATMEGAYTLMTFVACVCDGKWLGDLSEPFGKLEYDNRLLGEFWERHFHGLNEAAEWAGLSEVEIRAISYDIIRSCGQEPTFERELASNQEEPS